MTSDICLQFVFGARGMMIERVYVISTRFICVSILSDHKFCHGAVHNPSRINTSAVSFRPYHNRGKMNAHSPGYHNC
jgi:hypothetical protein